MALNLEESLQMDYAFAAIDYYNNSIQFALKIEDDDVKAECKAKLGAIYYKVFKNHEKARNYLYESVSYSLLEPQNKRIES